MLNVGYSTPEELGLQAIAEKNDVKRQNRQAVEEHFTYADQ